MTEHHISLESEFETEPVPPSHRQSLGSVAAIWFGFPMILTNAVFGGIICYNLGFWRAIIASVVGNAILFVYVGLLSHLAGSTGLNFAMLAQRTFGTRGYVAASGFLATIVVGWYAFQTGLTGTTVHESFGWNELVVTVVAAILYTGVTFIGVRALSIVGMIAAPLYVILGIVALCLIHVPHGLAGVLSYAGAGNGMTLGVAITTVVAGFADSGTMTADFTRWSRNGREAVMAAFTAFPVANLTAMVFGIAIVAAGAASAPATTGGDFMSILVGHGALLKALSLVFVFVNLGSVCTHCLYNGAISWSHLVGSKMRTLTIVLGVIGGLAAIAGVWSFFLAWLGLLGLFVPPIGAIMITDQIILRATTARRAPETVRLPAFLAWGIGSLAAIAIHVWMPWMSEAVVGMIVAGAGYALLASMETARATAAEGASL
ncbi:MAG TPA: cytosine permease [Rhodopila sp.]|jgi:cytosine permease|nr:cytosine permease [Rhodopila sp.]